MDLTGADMKQSTRHKFEFVKIDLVNAFARPAVHQELELRPLARCELGAAASTYQAGERERLDRE